MTTFTCPKCGNKSTDSKCTHCGSTIESSSPITGFLRKMLLKSVARQIEREIASESEEQPVEEGITYDQLMNHTDLYRKSNGRFTGTVLEVKKTSDVTGRLRVALDGKTEQPVFLDYIPKHFARSFQQGDDIWFYGHTDGLSIAKSRSGSSVKVPVLKVYEIERT